MASWRVSPVYKKSAAEVEIWLKDGQTIRRSTLFRNGSFCVETNNDKIPEDIDLENPNGFNMNEYSSENAEFIEIGDLWDGCHLDVEYPAEMSEQEIERLTDLWEEESYSAWEKAGWRNDETQYWFYGPLKIEKEL